MNTINFDITAGLSRGTGFSAKLSEEQKSAAEEILAQYDPEALSEEDVDAIKQQLRDAGIGPSRDLKDLLQEAGFDAEQFKPKGPGGEAGGPGGPGGAPPPPAEGLSEEVLKTLASIFEEYDAENLSEDDLSAIQQKLQDAGFVGKGRVVDRQA
jgi:hypothetical protein